MKITQIYVKNFKQLKLVNFKVNPSLNIFVGENDSGKTTLLEAISILTSGKLNGYAFEKQLKANVFNKEVRSAYQNSLFNLTKVNSPPSIILEAYCEDDSLEFSEYSGTNNALGINCPGIRVEVKFDENYSETYKQLLMNKEIHDIPIEFYDVNYQFFSGYFISYRFSPIKAIFIDTTKKNYRNIVDRFVTESITSYLSPEELIDLNISYRKSKMNFQQSAAVRNLNQNILDHSSISNRQLSIDLKEEEVDEWKKQLSVIIDETPFESIGFGSQNIIKIELAIRNTPKQVNMVLMEEPENNLSYGNMSRLINHISSSTGKQIFLTTHSSHIANKLNLNNLLLIREGEVFSFDKLPKETINYFKKLPGFDTLRMVLANRVVLVEGPTEELVFQRAYKDEYKKLPIENGIDIISVNSLAFKRYLDIALILKKPTIIVTDNDGDTSIKIERKYKEYLSEDILTFFYETNESLHTLETSIFAANETNQTFFETLKRVISVNNSMVKKSKEEIIQYMLSNKTEWAMRVFDSNESIKYPEYILNAIKKLN